jgi:DNA repair protein RadC
VEVKEDVKGHRKRLRERFLKSGLEGFQDYEIVELLISLGKPRTDCKPQAKEAICRFKSLRGVLEASLEELQKIKGIGPHSIFGIKFMQAVARRFLQERSLDKPVCASSQEIFDYFYHSMRGLPKEMIKVVFLNTRNEILEIYDISQGTVDSSHLYIREVIERAIMAHAVSFVMVHNHPSGNPDPSRSDRDLTKALIKAGSVMNIKLADHIIIGDNRFYSFAGSGFIDSDMSDLSG